MSWLSNTFTGDDDKRHAEDRAEWERQQEEEKQRRLAAARAAQKQMQLGLLGQMQGPQVSDAQKLRIKALQDESKDSPLVSDKFFQADRANLVQGGQQALSGVQNTQRAYGTEGGFSNQGSINDVYDRLGSQLAGLGQQSASLKAQKRDSAAEMQQAITDAQVAFTNSQLRAKQAIESGDYEEAQRALEQAYAAHDEIQRRKDQAVQEAGDKGLGRLGSVVGSVVSGAAKAASAMSGNPSAAMAEDDPHALTDKQFRDRYGAGSIRRGY